MHFSTIASAGLLATTAIAYPHVLNRFNVSKRQVSGAQNVIYWGQNGGSAVENNNLSTYCTADSGIDIIVLSFLYKWGNGDTIPSGTIGQSCTIGSDGSGQNCDALANAISKCQSSGIKVILSLGGAVGAYSLSSKDEATTIGQNLRAAYGSPNATSSFSSSSSTKVNRPFGKTFVNGFDFDLESNSGNEYYQYMISSLRSNFAKDPSNTYYITGAPQCPIPEPNMQEVITKSQFDYLWIQFYNNEGCSTDSGTNFNDWITNIAGTPSSGAKIFLGVPASEDAATGTASGAKFHLDPSELATLVKKYSSNKAFGGIMMWDAGFSDGNVKNGCTYAQQAHSILTTGSTC